MYKDQQDTPHPVLTPALLLKKKMQIKSFGLFLKTIKEVKCSIQVLKKRLKNFPECRTERPRGRKLEDQFRKPNTQIKLIPRKKNIKKVRKGNKRERGREKLPRTEIL